MKRKVLAILMTAAMTASLMACGGGDASSEPAADSGADASADESGSSEADTAAGETGSDEDDSEQAEVPAADDGGSDYGGITLTFLNSKPEITDAFKKVTSEWGDAHGVTFEVTETSNPNDTLMANYQSGDAPVLAVVDGANVLDFAAEHLLPLDGEAWADYTEMAQYVDDTLYGFPLTVESHCIVVNKAAVEENIGREFVAEDYKSIEEFEALLEEMRGNGMETPVAILPDIWSMVGHDFYPFYAYQDGSGDGAFALIDAVKEGKDIYEDEIFYNHADFMSRVAAEYNVNKADPLNADHDMTVLALADGEVGFLLNGTWTWPELESMGASKSDDYTIMAYPNGSANAGKVMAAPTKYIVIDNSNATEEQQAAAKEFLNYLVTNEAGQKALIDDLGIVCAFTNNPNVPSDPVNKALMQYISDGNTVTYLPLSFPSDYRDTITPAIQKLMTGEGDIRAVADVLNDYWRNNDPNGR